MSADEYKEPSLTADIVVVALDEQGRLRVLAIRRGSEPFKDRWALPGGFCEENESAVKAAARELEEETKLADVCLEQIGAFTDPGRDPRGWVVSVAHLAVLPWGRAVLALAGDDAKEVRWLELSVDGDGGFTLTDGDPSGPSPPIGKLAFDHDLVLKAALTRLRERVGSYGPALIPTPFAVDEVQRAFEAILGKKLDASVFRERLLSAGLIVPAEGDRFDPVPPRPGDWG